MCGHIVHRICSPTFNNAGQRAPDGNLKCPWDSRHSTIRRSEVYFRRCQLVIRTGVTVGEKAEAGVSTECRRVDLFGREG